jgi:hypothetical protein
VCGKNYSSPTEYAAKIMPRPLSMRQKLFHAHSVCGKNYSTPTQCAVKIYVGGPTVAVFFNCLLCNVYACDGSHVFAVDCETAVAGIYAVVDWKG